MGAFVAILALIEFGMTAAMLIVLVCLTFRVSALLDQCNDLDAEP
jgi:hypothetical protein